MRHELDQVHEPELRGSPRYISLIRAAKIITKAGEFACVIRDVSASGINLRLFHKVPQDEACVLELRNGERYDLNLVRQAAREASYRFSDDVDVDRLIAESWSFPKRQLRLALNVPLTVVTLSGRFAAETENMSQQGGRIRCDALLAIDQAVLLDSPLLPDIRAKVRWRSEGSYGLVFDNTFTLADFGQLAAKVQSPALLDSVI